MSMPAFAAATLPSTDAPPSVTANGTTWAQVSNALQLEYIDQNQSQYLNSNIELMGNVDMTGYTGWVPIGGNLNDNFSGTFNGQGYLISGLAIDGGSDNYVGFFGETSGTIENVGIDATVTGGILKGGTGFHTGGLVGFESSGSITNSYVSGSVTGDGGGISEGTQTGGMVGFQDRGSIVNSYSTASVTGGGNGELDLTGGLVGLQGPGGSIANSYATGSVSGGNEGTGVSSATGGLVGLGFAGTITDSFFDQVTTTQSSGVGLGGHSSGATGESDLNMKLAPTFTGWDFKSTWGISASVNNGYPYLLDSTVSSAPTVGQLPEVPLAGVLPFLGLAGLGALALARPRRVAKRG